MPLAYSRLAQCHWRSASGSGSVPSVSSASSSASAARSTVAAQSGGSGGGGGSAGRAAAALVAPPPPLPAPPLGAPGSRGGGTRILSGVLQRAHVVVAICGWLEMASDVRSVALHLTHANWKVRMPGAAVAEGGGAAAEGGGAEAEGAALAHDEG